MDRANGAQSSSPVEKVTSWVGLGNDIILRDDEFGAVQAAYGEPPKLAFKAHAFLFPSALSHLWWETITDVSPCLQELLDLIPGLELVGDCTYDWFELVLARHQLTGLLSRPLPKEQDAVLRLLLDFFRQRLLAFPQNSLPCKHDSVTASPWCDALHTEVKNLPRAYREALSRPEIRTDIFSTIIDGHLRVAIQKCRSRGGVATANSSTEMRSELFRTYINMHEDFVKGADHERSSPQYRKVAELWGPLLLHNVGMKTIDLLVRHKESPSGISEVFGAIILANAMRCTVTETLDSTQTLMGSDAS
jgi:hypothetical protein